MSAYYVYDVYDRAGRPIYVGSTRDLRTRLEQHAAESWWAQQAVKVKARVVVGHREARAAELARIRDLHPRWNIHGLPARRRWAAEHYHDYLTAKAMRGRRLPRGSHAARLCAEYRVRFGCELLVPAALTTTPSAAERRVAS